MTAIENIDTDWLTRTTGDPFADVGGMIIKYLSAQEPEKDILQLIKDVSDIYVNNWQGRINAFFLNSPITQPAYKEQQKRDETIRYYTQLINQQKEHIIGYCRISGRKTALYLAGRDNHILSGSGTFVNFHHNFQPGIYLSKEVLIRMFFVPLGLIQLSDKIALLYSNDDLVTEFFVARNVDANIRNIGIGRSEGVLKSDFRNPANALFEFAKDCIIEAKYATDRRENITINLYHFTNFGAKPEVKLYTFPATLFMFYSECIQNPDYRKDWLSLIYAYYRNSKYRDLKFNTATKSWESYKKGVIEESFNYENFKSWRNLVYEVLLEGRSILGFIRTWSKKNKFNFGIVELYQLNIRNMQEKTISKIKSIADFIVSQDENSIKKTITKLNGSRTNAAIRQLLLRMNVTNYLSGAKNPLFTLEEYVEYLFPEGANWKEIRDLLLIAIYQKLHEKQIPIQTGLPDDDEELNDTETENQ
jgi:CRISPR-associated protein Cst1